MSRFVLLEADRHAGLCLDPMPRGGSALLVPLGRSEIALAVADYPLFLAKDGKTGGFELVALVGLAEAHNLFWQNGRWAATYVPDLLLSAPFRLSSESPTGLAIDREDGRLGSSGEALFTKAGEPTATLVRERSRLERIVQDVEDGRRTAKALVAAGVIRELSVRLAFGQKADHLLEGLYSADPDRFAALDDAAVVSLFRSGDLAAAALLHSSLNQIERLRLLHNGRGGDRIADAVPTFV